MVGIPAASALAMRGTSGVFCFLWAVAVELKNLADSGGIKEVRCETSFLIWFVTWDGVIERLQL